MVIVFNKVYLYQDVPSVYLYNPCTGPRKVSLSAPTLTRPRERSKKYSSEVTFSIYAYFQFHNIKKVAEIQWDKIKASDHQHIDKSLAS